MMSGADTTLITHSKPSVGKRERAAVAQVLRSGKLSQGLVTQEFEKEMCETVGRRFAAALSSGTAALHLSLLALGVTAGDEVILPSYTCDALLQAVCYVGATPIVTDVNPTDFNLDTDLALKAVTRRTKAFIIPHTFGALAAAITELRKTHIPVIEDCAHTIGMETPSGRTGSLGDLSVFSFFATKYLATGEGGMITVDNRSTIKNIMELRDYTGNVRFDVRFNYKMTDLEAALGRIQLSRLHSFVSRRTDIAARYRKKLADISSLSFQESASDSCHSHYRFVIKLKRGSRPQLRTYLRKRGVVAGFGVLRSLHQLLKLNPKHYPVSERLTESVLSLPIYPALNNGDVDRVCNIIHDYYEQ